MTQHAQLIDLFKQNGNRLTLGQIMQTTLACEYRARMTDLRKQGYQFILRRGKIASANEYVMVEPFTVEENGQVLMRVA